MALLAQRAAICYTFRGSIPRYPALLLEEFSKGRGMLDSTYKFVPLVGSVIEFGQRYQNVLRNRGATAILAYEDERIVGL